MHRYESLIKVILFWLLIHICEGLNLLMNARTPLVKSSRQPFARNFALQDSQKLFLEHLKVNERRYCLFCCEFCHGFDAGYSTVYSGCLSILIKKNLTKLQRSELLPFYASDYKTPYGP